jgi:hypothetical protein
VDVKLNPVPVTRRRAREQKHKSSIKTPVATLRRG